MRLLTVLFCFCSFACVFGFDQFPSIEKLRFKTVKAIQDSRSEIVLFNLPNLSEDHTRQKPNAFISSIYEAIDRGVKVEIISSRAPNARTPFIERIEGKGLEIVFFSKAISYGSFRSSDVFCICDGTLYIFSQKGDLPRITLEKDDLEDAGLLCKKAVHQAVSHEKEVDFLSW